MQVKRLLCEYLCDPLGIDMVSPRLSWRLESSERGQKQTAYRVLVATTPDMLAAETGDLWDSGRQVSDQSLHVEYAGKPLVSRAMCYWVVQVWDRAGTPSAWSPVGMWSMGLLQPADWTAQWIGCDPTAGDAEFPWLRKKIVLDCLPSEGRIYVNSLGYHELYINGENVSQDVLSPAVTQLDRRSFYITHDVTGYLRQGPNCVALWLGRGWYRADPGGAKIQREAGPVARVQLELYDQAGHMSRVVTDATWKARPSPITRIDDSAWALRYDARREQAGWNTAEDDDAFWTPAQECATAPHRVAAQMVETNRIQRCFSPVSIEPCGKEAWLVDMGTTLAGWLKVDFSDQLESGQQIIFNYFDHLDEKKEPSYCCGHDEYIASGKKGESFAHRLNYQGFRYVKITGLGRTPKKEDITAFLIHTDFDSGSSFVCSNERLTAVHDMVHYTFRCLTIGGYMVDCPHLERLGYGGDGQASLESALMMYSLGPFYRSWLTAWRDSQAPDGDLPHTAPSMFAGGGPYWGAFVIAAPWAVYRHYQDRAILDDNYGTMKQWLSFVESHCANGNLLEAWPDTERRQWWLGDWATPLGIDQKHVPSVQLVNNCVRIYCYDLMAQIAGVLRKASDAARYRAQADALRPLVHQKFYDAKAKTYADGDQIDLAFPLLTGVVPVELRADIVRQLEDDILLKRSGHLAVGLVGVPVLVALLMALGRNDLIFTFTHTDTYPGWGYMLKHGATTTWEHWIGRRSFIHNCYNSIGAWFYQGLAGIQLDPVSPAFEHVLVRPAIVGDVTWVKASHHSIRGELASEWKLAGQRLEMTVRVPVGSTATVHVPRSGTGQLDESGHPAAEAAGVKFLRMEKECAVYQVESGTYLFASDHPVL